MKTNNMVQTANVTEKEEKGYWETNKGQGKIMGYLAEGWTVTINGATMMRSKSVNIPSI